ncbi:MAG: tetratricopeptide repeat protein [Planctomycetota bacterium]
MIAAVWAFGGFVGWFHAQAASAMTRHRWQASERWLHAAERVSADSRTAFLQARLCRKRARLEEMSDYLRIAEKRGFSRDLIVREALLAEAQTGRLTAIEKHLSELFQKADDDADEICEAYVNGCVLNYRFDTAATILELWEKDFPRDPQPHYIRGRINEYQGNHESAEADYRAALKLDDGHAPAAYNLARLLLTRQKPAEALELYRRCNAALEQRQPALVGMANCLRLLDRNAEARQQLEKAVTSSGPLVEETYRMLGETGEAAPAKAAAEFGQLELSEQHYAEAVRWLQQAVQANPRDWKVRFNYATSLQRTGEVQQAAVEFDKVQTTKVALAKVDKLFDDLKTKPNDPGLRYEIGCIFLDHVSEKQGIVWLNGALYFDSQFQPAHRRLADYFAEKTADDPRYADLAERHRRQLNPTPTGSNP